MAPTCPIFGGEFLLMASWFKVSVRQSSVENEFQLQLRIFFFLKYRNWNFWIFITVTIFHSVLNRKNEKYAQVVSGGRKTPTDWSMKRSGIIHYSFCRDFEDLVFVSNLAFNTVWYLALLWRNLERFRLDSIMFSFNSFLVKFSCISNLCIQLRLTNNLHIYLKATNVTFSSVTYYIKLRSVTISYGLLLSVMVTSGKLQ